MSDWFTARELADHRLPGLPHSRQNMSTHASREGWQSAMSAAGEPLARARQGRGGGWEFHVSLLPPVARTRLEAKLGRARPDAAVANDTAILTSRGVALRDARLFVLARADEFRRSHGDLNQNEADLAYAVAFQAGTAEVPLWVKAKISRLSGRTLRRWRDFRGEQRLDLVAGRHGDRDGAHAIARLLDGEIATFIGALIVKQPMLNASHIRGIVQGRFGEQLDELPSERSFRRFVSAWKDGNALALRKLTDPDGYKSAARLSGSNSNAHVRALNQLWEIDASPSDGLTTDGRHAIYVLVDIFSRRMMVYVTKTPRTEATLLLIRRAILAWGVPTTIRTDNGSDFTSQRFVSAMNALAIAHDVTDPFSPEQKGTVERAIGTLQRGLMRILPGFVGHSVADRKIIESRKAFAQRLGESDESAFCVDLSASDLQRYCDEWCSVTYAHHPHSGLDGMTPFAKAASFRGTIARVENERALDLLLAPVAGKDGWRQATKQGIRLDAGWFIAPEMLPGTRYFCRQDPEDMGRLYVFSDEITFLTVAICPERAGVDPRAAIRAAREKQAEIVAERTRELKSEARKIRPRDMVDWLQAGARRQSASVTAFPQKSERHESGGLSAAADAVSEADVPVIDAVTAPELVESKIVKLPETAKQRFTRAVRLEALIAGGDPVDAAEAMWLGSYQTTAEYRSHQSMLESFGPEAVLEKG